MQEVIKVNDKELPVIEWKGQRVITTAQLADIYETDVENVKRNFERNSDKFSEGENYFLLKGEELRQFKNLATDCPLVDKRTPLLYLWTRRGASRHCKMLGTDKAWEQFDALEENYYNPPVKQLPMGAELISLAVIEAQKVIEKKNEIIAIQNSRIQEMRPKEIFADAVSASHTSILIGDLAKLLKQNGAEIGQKRLFEWMCEKGYLIKRKGADWNMPAQRSMEMGLFEVKESTVNNPDGSVRINKTTKVTGKGQQYFINKFLNTDAA